MTNSVDPDQTADLGLRCLLVYLNQSVVLICSRRLQQTICSDVFFVIALMVLYDKQCGPRSDCLYLGLRCLLVYLNQSVVLDI